MPNKRIWELPSWVSSGDTFNNTLPIDNNFVTQKISLSAITEYVKSSLSADFSTINSQITGLQNQINSLSSQLSGLSITFSGLSTTVSNLSIELSGLTNTVALKLSGVTTDGTLTGDGTVGNPLSVV